MFRLPDVSAAGSRLSDVRDRDTIDAELRLLAAMRLYGCDHGSEPSSRRATNRPTSGYATARWTAERVGQSRTRCWRRQVEHNTCSVGIVAFRMPMRERTYVCEPFLRYLPG